MHFEEYLGEKTLKFYPAGPFFHDFLTKFLSKYPNSKKAPLLGKVSDCAPVKRRIIKRQGFLYEILQSIGQTY